MNDTHDARRRPDEQKALDLIAAYPLALVVSNDAEGCAATPLPLLAETDAAGRIVSLFGHFARANPHVVSLQRQPNAAFLFQGPQGYVSPRLVSQKHWAPTWNYAVVKFDGHVVFAPEETEASVTRLTEAMEDDTPDPWTTDELGERFERMKRQIIAFRAYVGPPQARFKLGAEETLETFEEIVERHPDRRLAEWMAWAGRPR